MTGETGRHVANIGAGAIGAIEVLRDGRGYHIMIERPETVRAPR